MMDLESEFGNVLEMGYGIVVGVGEHTGFRGDGICLESWFGNIPEMMGESCVPLHLQPSGFNQKLKVFFPDNKAFPIGGKPWYMKVIICEFQVRSHGELRFK